MRLIHFLKLHRTAATRKWLRSAVWKGLMLPIRPGTENMSKMRGALSKKKTKKKLCHRCRANVTSPVTPFLRCSSNSSVVRGVALWLQQAPNVRPKRQEVQSRASKEQRKQTDRKKWHSLASSQVKSKMICLSKLPVCFKFSCFSQALKKESDDKMTLCFLQILFFPRLTLFPVPQPTNPVRCHGIRLYMWLWGVTGY